MLTIETQFTRSKITFWLEMDTRRSPSRFIRTRGGGGGAEWVAVVSGVKYWDIKRNKNIVWAPFCIVRVMDKRGCILRAVILECMGNIRVL